MKKVLILAYDFPPYVSAGGLRPYNWYLNFKALGYDPVVITRQWDKTYGDERDYVAPSESSEVIVEETQFGKIIRTPKKPNLPERMLLKHGEGKFRFIRRLLSLYYELAQYVFKVGPKSQLYVGAKKYLAKNKVDVILATGEPFVLFHYASKLSKTYNTKWVADYRDPWIQNASRRKFALLRWCYTYFEKRALKNASAISTVSEYCQTLISPNLPDIPCWIQMNGFNSLHINDASEVKQTSDVLSLAFAGTLYPWHPIKDVLKRLEQFVNQRSDNSLRVRFFGTSISSELRNFINKNCPKLSSSIQFHPKVPNAELVKEISKDNLLLLFNDYEIIGTKIFNYLGVRRKILLCYSDDADSKKLRNTHFPYATDHTESHNLQGDVIKKTNSGEIVKNGDHLLRLLDQYTSEFSNTGQIACASKSVDKFARKYQVQQFSEFLNSIL